MAIAILVSYTSIGQKLGGNYGVLGKLQFIFGNQNIKLEAGLSAFGTANYGDAAMEGGVNLISGHLFKRHTIRKNGVFYGYEFFALMGIGQNSNLLGSTISNFNKTILFDHEGKGGFSGIGFGFQKEFLPKNLNHFNLKQGKILMRFSNANHALDITFTNDFKFGRLFNGEGTDYGKTGSLIIGFTKIESRFEAYRVGLGIELFTPKPNYAKTPNNNINSDDGRKNVWHTVSPYQNLFYANAFAFGSFQDEYYSVYSKAGINSQKLGAFVQNTLHDSFGLNPRFPWDVTANDKLLIEVSISGQLNSTNHD